MRNAVGGAAGSWKGRQLIFESNAGLSKNLGGSLLRSKRSGCPVCFARENSPGQQDSASTPPAAQHTVPPRGGVACFLSGSVCVCTGGTGDSKAGLCAVPPQQRTAQGDPQSPASPWSLSTWRAVAPTPCALVSCCTASRQHRTIIPSPPLGRWGGVVRRLAPPPQQNAAHQVTRIPPPRFLPPAVLVPFASAALVASGCADGHTRVCREGGWFTCGCGADAARALALLVCVLQQRVCLCVP